MSTTTTAAERTEALEQMTIVNVMLTRAIALHVLKPHSSDHRAIADFVQRLDSLFATLQEMDR